MSEFEELVKEISTQSKLPDSEVSRLIKEKCEELSGLVSKEGAAYIVGRELGITMIKEGRRQLKVRNIVSGLRNVDITARIFRIFEPREWEKLGKKGKVANMLIGDDSGTVRLSLWNEELKLLDKFSEGDIVKMTGGFVKEDNRSQLELRIGKGKIEVVEEGDEIPEGLPAKADSHFTPSARKRAQIAGVREGDLAEVRASIIKVFERKNPLFNICPECEGRVAEDKGVLSCHEHGVVKPKQRLVVSGVIDDGTGNMRAVFFGSEAEKILGMKTDEFMEFTKGNNSPDIYGQFPNLGKDFIISGRVKMDSFTEKLEIMVNSIGEVDVEKECEILIK